MFHYLLTVLLFVSCRILIGNLIARICIAVMLILMEKSRTRFVCNGVESLFLVESFLLSFTLPFCVLLLVQFKIHRTFQAREKKALQKVARHWEESQCWCSLSLSCVSQCQCARTRRRMMMWTVLQSLWFRIIANQRYLGDWIPSFIPGQGFKFQLIRCLSPIW